MAKKVPHSITYYVRRQVLWFDKVPTRRDMRSIEVSRLVGFCLVKGFMRPQDSPVSWIIKCLKNRWRKRWLEDIFSLEFEGQADYLWIMPDTFIQGLCFNDLSHLPFILVEKGAPDCAH